MAGTYTAAGSFAAMTVMQGITFAGAAMSLVGNVTGNKTLSKIGMVAGIAGGIGSLAEAKGWITKTPTLGETFGSTAKASASTVTGPTSGNQAAGNVSQADQAARNAELTQANQNAAATRTTGIETTGRGAQSADSYAGGNLTAPAADASTAATAPVSDLKSALGDGFSTGSKVGLNPNPATATLNANAEPGFFDSLKKGNLWDATKAAGSAINPVTNPYGAMAAGQIAQPISDYLSGKTDAEIDALEAQTGYADAKAMQMQEEIAREKQRRANLNAGYGQVNTGINVNPAVLGQAQAGGLISGAMQPAA